MDAQASLHLCNLAGRYGLARAREMLALEAAPTPVVAIPGPAPEAELVVPITVAVTVTPEPVEATPEPVVPDVDSEVSPEAAQRAAEDDGARNATVEQLKQALESRGIKFRKNSTHAALLSLWLNRQ